MSSFEGQNFQFLSFIMLSGWYSDNREGACINLQTTWNVSTRVKQYVLTLRISWNNSTLKRRSTIDEHSIVDHRERFNQSVGRRILGYLHGIRIVREPNTHFWGNGRHVSNEYRHRNARWQFWITEVGSFDIHLQIIRLSFKRLWIHGLHIQRHEDEVLSAHLILAISFLTQVVANG